MLPLLNKRENFLKKILQMNLVLTLKNYYFASLAGSGELAGKADNVVKL